MGMSQPGSRGALSEINVTPMVDVILVLLIIFMVTAPFMQQGVAVDLPHTKAQILDIKEDRMRLTLTHRKKIYIGKAEIPYRKLREKLAGNLKLRQDKEVLLHADRRLSYGFVVDVMAVMKDAGVESVGMVTEPASP